MIYHLQALLGQPLHLGIVVHNVTQAIEPFAVRKLLLCGANGVHHSKTKTCFIVNLYLHRGSNQFYIN
jgi:hypothetical protein